MKKQSEVHQQSILDSSGLLPAKSLKAALVHIAILIVVVFFTEISNARADMVFDFQMKLAQKGNAEAQLKVGEMYEAGRGVEKDMEQAMNWISKAAEQGNKAAGYKLLYYDLKKNSLARENGAQLDELINAANAGEAYAQYYIGLMNSRGVGMRKDSKQAVTWLSKASLQGITEAEEEIGRINEAKQPKVSPKRIQKPVKTNPIAKTQVKQEEQQRQKMIPTQNVTIKKDKTTASRSKTEANTGLPQQRQAERFTAENSLEKRQSTAQQQAATERQRQAMIEQHAQREQRQKTNYESDACEGKSARFLSSCR